VKEKEGNAFVHVGLYPVGSMNPAKKKKKTVLLANNILV
jgi:hypothetical protein